MAENTQRASKGDAEGVLANTISLKFCFGSEMILATINIVFLKTVDERVIYEYDDLTDPQIRFYFEKNSETNKESIAVA